MNRKINKNLATIIGDNTSGSAAIRESLAGLFKEILLIESTSDSEAASMLRGAAEKAFKSHQSMAAIYHLCKFINTQLKNKTKKTPFKASVLGALGAYCSKIRTDENKLFENGAKIIKDKMVILTYSYSTAVLQILKLASLQGKNFSVICPESRPAFEGVRFAEEIAKQKIKTTLIVDAAIYGAIKSCDMILVGADTVTTDGIINKTGTEWIATSAKALKKPAYSAFTIEKVLPSPHSKKIKILNKPSYEVYKGKVKSIEVENRYFDITPLHEFSGFITEMGAMTEKEITNILKGLK
ncbi:MAG: hypothetical protein HZA77_10000 [Candidatus Schekmanbacteria bacterium]|nr:hypothetical protein [Candidatus Schekmanbacteria bacterium]